MTKHERLWAKARKIWIKNNPPSHQGYYECTYCHKWVPADEITIDHIWPRSARPDLRYVQSNLVPACWSCNGNKGSSHPVIMLSKIDQNLPF